MRAILAVVLALVAASAGAAPVTFYVCDSPSFSQPKGTDKLIVKCPGKAEPAFIVVGCVGPQVQRINTYKYTLTCAEWVPYTLTKK